LCAAGEVGICEEVRIDVGRLITHPADEAMGKGGMDVAHKPMKFAVALGVPFLEEEGQMLTGTDKVWPGVAGTV
jgi:hypothetical protein